MSETEFDRRKGVITSGRTDLDRWIDPCQLDPAWEAGTVAASGLIPAGSAVLDIGCGAMLLRKHLPFGCEYVPCDVVPRDDATLVVDLNKQALSEDYLHKIDLVVMLGVWEYLYKPEEVFSALARSGKPLVASYCVTDLGSGVNRRTLGWVNDYSLMEFRRLAAANGYVPTIEMQIDSLQYLFKFEQRVVATQPQIKRVHVISYLNVGNFGDRLGFHLINDILPPHAIVTWGTLRPLSPVPDDLDLLIIGIGNSLFGDLINEGLINAAANAKKSIGIFGTQYRELWPRETLGKLLGNLTHWYARSEEDIALYRRGCGNVSHLGDWLINAFPLAIPDDDKTLVIGKEIWKELPLDRTIQQVQRYKSVRSERLHPLLCAMTSAVKVGYKEQRESGLGGPGGDVVSGKFRSMLMDIFGRTYPEGEMWTVDRDAVVRYKEKVRRNTDAMRTYIHQLLS